MKFVIQTKTCSVFSNSDVEKENEVFSGVEVERISELETGDNSAEIRIELPDVGYFYLELEEAEVFGRLLLALSKKDANEIQFS